MIGRLAVLVLCAAFAPAAAAQRPTVAHVLSDVGDRDTVVTVWLFARADHELSAVDRLVVELGGAVRRHSRWLHAVSATLSGRAFQLARERQILRHIQPVAQFRGPRFSEGAPALPAARPLGRRGSADTLFGPSAMPVRQLNVGPLVERGFRGMGIKIALLDTGFETEDVAFERALVIAQRDFVHDDSIVRNDERDGTTLASRHGTGVWSLLAAFVPTQLVGLAPEAEYILAKTEDVRSERRVEEDNFVAALEWADSLGAQIVSSSLTYLDFDGGFAYSPDSLNGDVAVTTVAADSAAARGIVVVAAAGNNGTLGFRSIGTPADGDSVITVGAEDSLGTLQTFSSRGPTADGRLKPDLTAPGRAVFVLDPASATGFSRLNGTSFSAPLIAGTAALLREIHPLLGPVEIRDALRRTGTNQLAPDSSRGWGRPDATAAATFPLGIQLTSPSDTLLTTVTPHFTWMAPAVPPFARPLTYRLLIGQDASFSDVLVDTTLAANGVQLASPLAPDTRLRYRLTAVSPDTVTLQLAPDTDFIVPAWATLLSLSDPAGVTIRDPRPVLRWTSPDVVSPPGPFRYDVTVFRAESGGLEVVARDLTETSFTPTRDLERNTPYRWRVVSRLGDDSVVAESRGAFVIVDESTPTATLLFQNFPNPFPNRTTGLAATCVWFDLAAGGRVRLDILDLRGHLVRNLVPGDAFPDRLEAGRYGRAASGTSAQCDPRLQWDGTARDGTTVPRGIYVIKLETPNGTFFKRIVFLGKQF